MKKKLSRPPPFFSSYVASCETKNTVFKGNSNRARLLMAAGGGSVDGYSKASGGSGSNSLSAPSRKRLERARTLPESFSPPPLAEEEAEAGSESGKKRAMLDAGGKAGGDAGGGGGKVPVIKEEAMKQGRDTDKSKVFGFEMLQFERY